MKKTNKKHATGVAPSNPQTPAAQNLAAALAAQDAATAAELLRQAAASTSPAVRSATKVKQLHIMQCSLQFTDSAAKIEDDVRSAMAKGPDVIGFTEGNSDKVRKAINKQARANGYAPIVFSSGDVHLAVKTGGKSSTRVTDKGNVAALRNLAGYSDKYIAYVTINWWGSTITVCEAHWVLINERGTDLQDHAKITQAMITQVKNHATGKGMSFFMGDINVDEGRDNERNAPNYPNYLFKQAGLLTIWDELSVVPRPTIKRSVFDIIGSYRLDKQVEGTEYKIWPKNNSDHSQVSAYYDVDVSVPGSAGGSQGGANGDGTNPTQGDATGVADGPVLSAGNQDFSDYLDDTLYPLPYAVDDSSS